MASNYTEHYNLCQWEATDQVLRTDFNEDNAKVDEALGILSETVAEHDSTIAKLGNCQIVFGTYTGTGTFGVNGPTTLKFDHKPVFVAIRRQDSAGNNDTMNTVLIRNSGYCFPIAGQINTQDIVIWADTSVSWYIKNGSPFQQVNEAGAVYCYVALLQISE